jgi:hypothetical protein
LEQILFDPTSPRNFPYDYDVLNLNSELADAVQASVEESAPM